MDRKKITALLRLAERRRFEANVRQRKSLDAAVAILNDLEARVGTGVLTAAADVDRLCEAMALIAAGHSPP